VTVRVGSGGRVSVFNPAGYADVIFDVVGYYDATVGDGFTSVAPARVLDSRPAGPQVGPYGTPWGPGQIRDVTVAGFAGVPAGADAVVVNVTVTDATAGGYMTVWPAGQPQPTASSLNWAAGQTLANAVTVKVGAGGKVSVFNAAGSIEVLVDVVGFFASGSGQLFHPLAPTRIQDSRSGSQVGLYPTPWGPNVSRDVQVGGVSGVSAAAAAVLLNVTATGTTDHSFLKVWPLGSATPATSSLNWAPAQTVPNAVTARLGSFGRISVLNFAGNVDVIADVAGWYG